MRNLLLAAVFPVLALEGLAVADDFDPNQRTCTTWDGDAVYDVELAESAGKALVVARVVGRGDGLVAIPVSDRPAARPLSGRASTFRLVGGPAGYLLVTQNGLQEAVVGVLLQPDGRERGAAFTIYPGGGDRHVHEVWFDGVEFAVIVDTGDVIRDEPWLVRVSTGGQVVGAPTALAVANNAVLLRGPAAGELWAVEERSESQPWRVAARVLARDGSPRATADLGPGRARGAARSASGDLLVLHDPDAGPPGTFASMVTPTGAVGPAAQVGEGYFQVAARDGGGFLALQTRQGTITGVVLDERGAPAGPAVAWARGDHPRLTGTHVAWSIREQQGDLAHSQAAALPLDATGAPGTPRVLLATEQHASHEPCGPGCTLAPPGARRPTGALALLVLLALALALTRRKTPVA